MLKYYDDANDIGLVDFLLWCNQMKFDPYNARINYNNNYDSKIIKRTNITLFSSIITDKDEHCFFADGQTHYDSITCHFDINKIIIIEKKIKKLEHRINIFKKILALNSNAKAGDRVLPSVKMSYTGNILTSDIYLLIKLLVQKINMNKDIENFILQIYSSLILKKIAHLDLNN